jgi:hypothetical protein
LSQILAKPRQVAGFSPGPTTILRVARHRLLDGSENGKIQSGGGRGLKC